MKNVSDISRLKFCNCLELLGPWVFKNCQRDACIRNLARSAYNIRIACHLVHRTFKAQSSINKLFNTLKNVVKEDTYRSVDEAMMLFKCKPILKMCVPKITKE